MPLSPSPGSSRAPKRSCKRRPLPLSTSNVHEDLQGFIRASVHLTGVQALDEELSRQLLERLRSDPVGNVLPELIAEFRSIELGGGDIHGAITDRVMQSPTLGPLAKAITLLWYTSAFKAGNEWSFDTARQYFGALMWPAIGAHPPALSGGYFGYWRYPPEH